MAAKRSQTQLAPLGEFIRSLYELGEYATWKEFADEAGISQGQVSEFKNAQVEPHGLNLLRLIRASAQRVSGDAASVAARSAPRVPLGELEGGVSDLLVSVEAVLQNQVFALLALGVPEDQIVRPESVRASQQGELGPRRS